MPVTFNNITRGNQYSRPQLAEMWGYAAYQALARGVVTPRKDNKIILFVTEEKQSFQEQYNDHFDGKILHWEGPTDHFAEDRMINAERIGDEIHIFHRKRHHSDFKYLGQARVVEFKLEKGRPSRFTLEIK